MNHIVEQIGSIVTAMQDLEGKPYYMYGHRVEINERLLKKNDDKVFKYQKYPLIALRWETPEDVSNGMVDYNLNIVFLYSTEKKNTAEQRHENVIKPILTPLYEQFLIELKRSGLFQWEGDQKTPPHTKLDRPYWGVSQENGNIKNIFSDPLDGIEITNLRIKGRRYEGCDGADLADARITTNINGVEMLKSKPYSVVDLEVVNSEGAQYGSKLSSTEWGIPDIQYQVGANPIVEIPYTDELIVIPSGDCPTLNELWEASTQSEKIAIYIALSDADLIALYLALSDAQRLVMYQGLSDAQRLALFVGLPTQDQIDLYNGLTDVLRLSLFNALPTQDQIDLYNGLTDVLRKSLFDQLTDSQKNYILPIKYAYPIPTGQITIYSTYDDASIEQTIFSAVRVAQTKWHRKAELVDFYTLRDNNVLGNTFRFTLVDGSEPALATGGQYIIDHYQGIGFLTGNLTDGTTRVFTAALTYVDGLSTQGFSDYFIGNYNIAESLTDKNLTVRMNKYESKAVYCSSTSIPSLTTSVLISQSASSVRNFPKVNSSLLWLVCRIHY
jgi:hypothetical protein